MENILKNKRVVGLIAAAAVTVGGFLLMVLLINL